VRDALLLLVLENVDPSPNVQSKVAPASADEDPPSKLQANPVHVDVKRATGGPGGPEVMKPEYRNLLVVPEGTVAVVLAFALRSLSTSAAVAEGWTWR
jgi:hypothetical protein